MLKKKGGLGAEKRLVITFETPNAAFTFEAACKEAGMPGRLMPAPVALTGGCGIGWTAPLEQKKQLEDFVAQRGLKIKLIAELTF